MELAQAGRSRRVQEWVRSYFRDQDPDFWTALAPALLLSVALYVRSPLSNYIFDEQEALLANPYVNGAGEVPFLDAFKRDFWGLLPERSIGSYRPLPNLVWRLLWNIGNQPFLHHWVNLMVHAVNAALLSSFVLAVTRRRGLSWLAGACFLASAVITEAVTGVVGIADVFGGLGTLLGLHALRLKLWAMPLGVFAGISFGLFSKESVLVAIPLVAWVALVTAPALHEKPRRVLRALLALVATVLALVVYTELRKRWFPVTSATSLPATNPGDSLLSRALGAFLRWFQQPQLPHDPINNPLVDADLPHRISGALRVYVRGLGQLVFPWTLSGDYSYPAEPVPAKVVNPEAVAGGLLMVLPPLFGVGVWIRTLFSERRLRRAGSFGGAEIALASLVAIGAVWVPLAYFPHSNIPVLLPTVRAERFWYLPAMGGACLFAALFTTLADRNKAKLSATLAGIFFAVQTIQARAHALDYTNDLVFWRATRQAVPNSAKAHLNYSVMLGARDRLAERLAVNARAIELAPRWPMAHVYYGDTLCRMKRAAEAWPHYRRGFELAPNDPNLISLALQCLWDQKSIEPFREPLLELSEKHPGTWLAYLATDIVYNGETHGGVQKKYRPRSYDEGPKK